VLVVDDNQTNRRILERLLTRWGMHPVCVESGRKALDELNSARSSGNAYRLVLTDMHMPNMDGFALAEQIRSTPNLATATIMMLSSAGSRGDMARCQQLGLSASLTKPVRQNELRDAIVRALDRRGLHPGASRVAPPTVERRAVTPETVLEVLLAEDNEINQRLATRLLQKRGHRVTVVGNGREAVDLLERSSFDLVMMDVQMPLLDGIAATTLIREREKGTGAHHHIVALTAYAVKGDQDRCIAAGMDGYLAKPIRPEELDALLQTCVARGAEAYASPAVSSLGAERDADMTNPEHASLEQYVNMTELQARVDNDRELLEELFTLFQKDFPRLRDALHDAVDSGGPLQMEKAAHTLKGMLANLSIKQGAELAAGVEAAARAGDALQIRQALAAFDREAAGFSAALDVFMAGWKR
jgi:CheY-like chemotaxis protein